MGYIHKRCILVTRRINSTILQKTKKLERIYFLALHFQVTMKVLIALDHHEVSLKAMRFYLANIHKPGQELVGFHLSLQEKLPAGGTPEAQKKLVELCKAKEAKLKKKCDKLIDEVGNSDTKFEFRVVEKLGSFDAEEIGKFVLEEIKKVDAGLVILGCRGHLKLKHFLGSVSDFVVKQCDVPTLVLKLKLNQKIR